MNLYEYILDKANNPTKEECEEFMKKLRKHAKRKALKNKNKQL